LLVELIERSPARFHVDARPPPVLRASLCNFNTVQLALSPRRFAHSFNPSDRRALDPPRRSPRKVSRLRNV
jgi:hypothetical protein